MSALQSADRAALSDLVHRYAANVDDRQFEAVAELFTGTAELTVP
jgi:3-phenylpropionate/cinnamic acid dioxygenase small subunit